MRSISFLASRSSFTDTTYQDTFPSNLPVSSETARSVRSLKVISFFVLMVLRMNSLICSYLASDIFTPFFPCGCKVKIFSSFISAFFFLFQGFLNYPRLFHSIQGFHSNLHRMRRISYKRFQHIFFWMDKRAIQILLFPLYSFTFQDLGSCGLLKTQ